MAGDLASIPVTVLGWHNWLACPLLTRQVLSSPPGRVIPTTIIKMVQTDSLHGTLCIRVGVWQWFGSAAKLSKGPGSVWNCLWGHALKRSPGINRKNRVSYPGTGFLSSAT